MQFLEIILWSQLFINDNYNGNAVTTIAILVNIYEPLLCSRYKAKSELSYLTLKTAASKWWNLFSNPSF